MDIEKSPSRRGFLQRLNVLLVFGLIAGWLKALSGYLNPPARHGKIRGVNIDMDQFLTVSSLVVEYRGNPVIIIRLAEKEGGETMKAFSAECTHLGCIVKWVSEKKIFLCPCHAGTFDSMGNVISGPPPEPLRQYPLTLDNNIIKFI